MTIHIDQVDAFTDQPFKGNPAAVCLLPEAASEAWMQALAAEMNLSETAFLVPRGDVFDLRWFTPTVEVALCGHATLASAHVLWERGILSGEAQARFHTKSGLLTADKRHGWIELNFPATVEEPAEAPEGLVSSLHLTHDTVRYVGRSRFDYLVEADTDETVRSLAPDFSQMKSLPVRGVMVTARSTDPAYDFISRFFGPGSGIDEDPVTGSAHCCLAPFWAKHLGKSEFTAYQASRRGGVLRLRLENDRVVLAGQAVTVTRGELCVDVERAG